LIDGVKISLSNTAGVDWLNTSPLSFSSQYEPNTGEVLNNGNMWAVCDSLRFGLVNSTTSSTVHHLINGSLHTYHNEGVHNYNDFTLSDLNNVISDLQTRFSIAPESATLQNLEIGVNIETKQTPKQIINSLIAVENRQFTAVMYEGRQIGKQIKKQQYRLKIYDKGKQFKTGKNILRVELAFNKMAIPHKYGVYTLADLNNTNKVYSLAQMLVGAWDEILFFDGKRIHKEMTNQQQKRFLLLINPTWWTDGKTSKHQRRKAKQRLKELFAKYGTTTQTEISRSITEKIQLLTAQKGLPINQLLESKQHIKGRPINRLNTQLISSPNTGNQNIEKALKNRVEKEDKNNDKILPEKTENKKCLVCGSDISHKRKGSKYCSKKCNNKHNGMKRTKERQKVKIAELPKLERIIKILPKNRIFVDVSYRDEGEVYTDTLHQSEIKAPPEIRRNIIGVRVTGHHPRAKPVILTHARARKLIRIISKNNKCDERINE